MDFTELILLAVGLSMDAFAVAICKGLSAKQFDVKRALVIGLWFGGFQAGMPLIGYFLGTYFEQYITAIDHWIVFFLLGCIGIGMIREALKKDEDCCGGDCSVSIKAMLPLALATSIDAMAVGITFAFLAVNVVFAVVLIGMTTFILSAVGVKIGNAFGAKYKSKAELCGGTILILLGIKVLLEHLGVL